MLNQAKQINVLIVVDVVGALASGDLGANVYLIDSNKYCGSGNEGQQELVTACIDGQVINWSVASVDPGTDAELVGFTGQMVNQKICVPQQITPVSGETYWAGRVESQGTVAQYQYSCTLSFDGKSMTFDPFINVKAS